jgi:tetratricopeptide (TPR) repeat protein
MTTKPERSGLDAAKKWIALGAAVLSLGSGIFGVLRMQAQLTAQERAVTEKLAAGRLQQQQGDYEEAWASYQEAAKSAAAAEGPIARLIGGSSVKRQEAIQAAQEDLAMEWLRAAQVSEGHTFAEITDKVVPVLSVGQQSAAGARKADLEAHIGWAYFLKGRDADTRTDPVSLYRAAVAVDATNPYANTFWGHWIMVSDGALAQAKQHFAAALASGRERATVRHFQLAALAWRDEDHDADAAWWQAVDEMHKNGEPIDEDVLHEMDEKYFFALSNDSEVKRFLAAVPPADQVELGRLLLQSSAPDKALRVKAVLALTLEAAGKADEALAAWRDVEASAHGDLAFTLTSRMNDARKRLGAAAAKGR